jgi:hypothetical protein
MTNKEYYLGEYGAKYGIWNYKKCEFQLGIVEDTPMLAEGRLFHLIGNDARKIKFSPRKISEGEIAKMLNKKKDKKERCNNGMEQEGRLNEQQ